MPYFSNNHHIENVSNKSCNLNDTYSLCSTMVLLRQLLAVPWPRPLATEPWFAPDLLHMGFVMDKVESGEDFLRVLLLSPVSIIPPMLHTHISSGG
jgi:hypothetical protein